MNIINLEALLRSGADHFSTVEGAEALIQLLTEAADAMKEFRRCKNELCLKCGAYTRRHLGACDGCRWKDM